MHVTTAEYIITNYIKNLQLAFILRHLWLELYFPWSNNFILKRLDLPPNYKWSLWNTILVAAKYIKHLTPSFHKFANTYFAESNNKLSNKFPTESYFLTSVGKNGEIIDTDAMAIKYATHIVNKTSFLWRVHLNLGAWFSLFSSDAEPSLLVSPSISTQEFNSLEIQSKHYKFYKCKALTSPGLRIQASLRGRGYVRHV